MNLVDNAIKYSPNGGDIEVKAYRIEGGTPTISVRDHGLGIPPEKRSRIFERFYRAHTDIVLEGLGLGLFLSREILKAHGGSIDFADPEDGKGGTVFTIKLPDGQDPL